MSAGVLIVGATGPLGRAVGSDLHAHGHRVTSTSRRSAPLVTQLDAFNLEEVELSLQHLRPSSIVYLARPPLAEAAAEHEIGRAKQTFGGFVKLCARYGASRIVFASSASVYGTRSAANLTETSALEPRPSSYARLKIDSERTLESTARSVGISAVSLRIFNIYGPGFASSLVNRLAVPGTPVPSVFDTDSFQRDYIHASDVARVVRCAVEIDNVESPVLNVGTGIGTGNRSLLRLFPRAAHTLVDAPDTRSFSIADTGLLRSALAIKSFIELERAAQDPHEFF